MTYILAVLGRIRNCDQIVTVPPGNRGRQSYHPMPRNALHRRHLPLVGRVGVAHRHRDVRVAQNLFDRHRVDFRLTRFVANVWRESWKRTDPIIAWRQAVLKAVTIDLSLSPALCVKTYAMPFPRRRLRSAPSVESIGTFRERFIL